MLIEGRKEGVGSTESVAKQTRYSWHLLKAVRFFCNNFTGIISIKLAGFKKIKISFNIIVNENNCLKSKLLSEHGFSASIPSFIYSYSVIKLDLKLALQFFQKIFFSPS